MKIGWMQVRGASPVTRICLRGGIVSRSSRLTTMAFGIKSATRFGCLRTVHLGNSLVQAGGHCDLFRRWQWLDRASAAPPAPVEMERLEHQRASGGGADAHRARPARRPGRGPDGNRFAGRSGGREQRVAGRQPGAVAGNHRPGADAGGVAGRDCLGHQSGQRHVAIVGGLFLSPTRNGCWAARRSGAGWKWWSRCRRAI
jgi:hypothetical protein